LPIFARALHESRKTERPCGWMDRGNVVTCTQFRLIARVGIEPRASQREQGWLLDSRDMPVFTEDKRTHDTKAVDNVQALVQLLRNRSYEEIRQRMYDSAPGSPWWSACKAELDLRNGQQLAEASVAMSRVTEKMRSSTQHFEQLADTLCQATNDVADLLRKTEAAGRRLEIAVYVAIGVSLVQFFNLIFEVFRKR
jgi:hypothetical protein